MPPTTLFASAPFVSSAHAADEAPKVPTLTGHADLVTKYILRGASTTYGNVTPGLGNSGADAPESDKPALQWGLDYALTNGVAFDYFGPGEMLGTQRVTAVDLHPWCARGKAMNASTSFSASSIRVPSLGNLPRS